MFFIDRRRVISVNIRIIGVCLLIIIDKLKTLSIVDPTHDNRTLYSGNHHTCSCNVFVLLFCSLEYISITMSSNGNLTMQV